MRKQTNLFILILFLILLSSAGCIHHPMVIDPTNVPGKIIISANSKLGESQSETRISDPWTYCLTAPESQEDILQIGMSDSFSSDFRNSLLNALEITQDNNSQQMIIWRCSNQSVYACNASQYSTCVEKVNFSVKATEIMIEACKDSALEGMTLPPAVTGKSTAFDWVCTNGEPVATNQVIAADEAGYNQYIWYLIK